MSEVEYLKPYYSGPVIPDNKADYLYAHDFLVGDIIKIEYVQYRIAECVMRKRNLKTDKWEYKEFHVFELLPQSYFISDY